VRCDRVELHPQGGEEAQREHGQRDVPVPAVPGTDFVIGEADLLLGHLEAFLNGPASTGDLREGSQGGPVRAENDVIGEILRILATAPDQQPMLPRRLLQPGQA
jgi:hypothetical protein